MGVQQKSHWETSVVLLPEIVSQGLQQFLRIDQELRLICDSFAPVLESRPDQSGNFLLVTLNHNGFTGCNLIEILKEVLAEVKPFMAFPNPSQGTMDLLLDFAEGTRVQWTLIDLNGRVAAQGEIQSEGPMIEPMDFSALAKGMYILNLTTPERHYTERVVLQ